MKPSSHRYYYYFCVSSFVRGALSSDNGGSAYASEAKRPSRSFRACSWVNQVVLCVNRIHLKAWSIIKSCDITIHIIGAVKQNPCVVRKAYRAIKTRDPINSPRLQSQPHNTKSNILVRRGVGNVYCMPDLRYSTEVQADNIIKREFKHPK